MSIRCWLFGHERAWRTMPDGVSSFTLMNFTQEDQAGTRSRDIHMCERCGVLYWAAPPTKVEKARRPRHLSLESQVKNSGPEKTPPVTGFECGSVPPTASEPSVPPVS